MFIIMSFDTPLYIQRSETSPTYQIGGLREGGLVYCAKKAPPIGGAFISSRQQPKKPHSSFSREAQSKLQNISVTSLVWIRSCKNTVIIPHLPPRCKCNACQKWEGK